MKTYLDFEVHIGAAEADRLAVAVSGPGGEARGVLVLPVSDPGYCALTARLQRLDTDETTLVAIGQFLFDALFHGPVRDVYTRSQGVLSEQQGLRVRLHIAPTEASVAALPWEFLYDPDQGPLALLDTPVVRFLPQQDRMPVMAAPLPLRVLLTAAQTPPAVDVERELTAARDALASMGERVDVTLEPHLTTSKFQSLLRSGFHVWHFVGHGGFARDGTTGQLLFEDASGDPETISALQLGIMVNRSGLRLVVLDAC
ncbi:MAG TPA: CHAT domain-containing protein, partial [Roseiflexaceae bacterium]|nr:CHAT domain-containing protein [Roseiflexaceae bacterium]